MPKVFKVLVVTLKKLVLQCSKGNNDMKENYWQGKGLLLGAHKQQ